MTTGRGKPKKTQRGSIERLPSGCLRVRVYAGTDPVTGSQHYLREIVEPGPNADKEAEKTRTRLLNQVDERRHPRTSATVNQLLDKYLDQFDGENTTLRGYRGLVRNHIAPLIGEEKVGSVDADILDSLYAELRRCRLHCRKRRFIEHRTPRPHDCDHRCGPHRCKPLGASSIRQIHFILSGAFKRAVRWRWVAISPVTQAEPPAAPKPDPRPPSADEAARILNEAWKDLDWGTFVWTAMTTGARRSELCALRWRNVDLDAGVITLRTSLAYDDQKRAWIEKDTKTHQQRRIALDPDSLAVLIEHRERCDQRAALLGLALAADAYVFSLDPDNSTHLLPDSVTQRYDRLADRLEIDTTLHKLRHYSATELISAGVDLRTVAGRLGHGDGTTTMKVYTAWVAESDQRAATSLSGRMPSRPTHEADPTERAKVTPEAPFEKIAAEFRNSILSGQFAVGTPLPPVKEIATSHEVSVGTAHRALSLLKTWGLIDASRGRRATVLAGPDQELPSASVTHLRPVPATPPQQTGPALLDIDIRRLGKPIAQFTVEADPDDTRQLRHLLTAAVRRDGRAPSEIADYEMDIRLAQTREHLTTFVVLSA